MSRDLSMEHPDVFMLGTVEDRNPNFSS